VVVRGLIAELIGHRTGAVDAAAIRIVAGAVLQVPAGREGATATAGENHRDVDRAVRRGLAELVTPQDDGVVEYGAAGRILNGIEAREQLGDLLRVPALHLHELQIDSRVTGADLVGDVVVNVRVETDPGHRRFVTTLQEVEGDDARQI